MAETAFINTYIRTIASQPVTYADDYAQPSSNALKRVPVIPIPVPAVPVREDKPGESSSSDVALTLKSLKPPKSINVTVKGTDTIADLKAKWESNGGEVRLLLKGKALQDSKLVREYAFKGGEVVNVVVKAAPVPEPSASPSLSPIPAPVPSTPSLAINTSTPTRGHSRIPSVVLSPSPSIEDGRRTPEPSPKNIVLNLDGEGDMDKEVSTYQATLAKPELWEHLLAFLNSEFSTTSDAQLAFEDFLRASKGALTASEIAKIRDQVGVIGMAGT